MKITLDVIKSRLKMMPNIETAAIYCELEEDGMTIKQDERIVIVFSISTMFYISKKEKEEDIKRYEDLAQQMEECYIWQR